ncbi:OPA3-like protein [Macadamia integrifolia]|uniref:OPA3-like protein n=1 Tax=Macadamia integrifolia TaxID=60698 RepID=UPI001C500ED4|nr:OPA3-like protein [Macadamia integrifolia]
MVLPLLKLETLALKTLCKPIANRLKKEAGLHPRFRQLIINFAQANHRFQTNVQRRFYGHATEVEIRPLNEEKAVEDAADLIGELFVFSVAGGVVVFEVQRSARSEARKEELRSQELEPMRQKDEEMAGELELLKHKFEELEHLARGRGLSGHFNFKPLATENVKSTTPH